MSSWPFVRLGDICEKITDGTHHSPPNHPEGDYKYITAKNIKPWGLDLSDVTYVDAATHREIYARCDVRKGDILYVKDGATTGRLALNSLDEEFSLLSSVGVLRPGPAVRPRYLAYALQDPATLDRMLADTAGVAITRLTLRKLNDAEVRLAPLACQDRIVEKLDELLSGLDAAVDELKAAQRKLAQYRQSLLKAAVEGVLSSDWRAAQGQPQEAGAELLQRILSERRARWEEKQLAKFAEQGKKPQRGWQTKYPEPIAPDLSELSSPPKGWVWATIDQLSIAQKYGTSAKTSGGNSGVPVLRMGNIQDGELDCGSLKYLPDNHEEFPDLFLDDGEMLFNRTNSPELVGKTAVYRSQISPCSYASYLIAVKFTDSFIPEIASAYINSVYGRNWIKSVVVQQVGQANVNGTKLAALSVPLPPIEEQAQIADILETQLAATRQQEASIEHGLRQAAAQRKNILKTAFAGQLVPLRPDDEPVSELLARIRSECANNAPCRRRKSA